MGAPPQGFSTLQDTEAAGSLPASQVEPVQSKSSRAGFVDVTWLPETCPHITLEPGGTRAMTGGSQRAVLPGHHPPFNLGLFPGLLSP